MSIEKAKAHLKKFGLESRILEFEVSSATVALAAAALGTEEKRIAKTLSFDVDGETVLVVVAGDARVNNSTFKAFFGKKPKMLPLDEVESRVGYAVGGVCPFGVNEGVRVYVDESVKRFETVFPAAGTSSSAVEMTPDELFSAAEALGWVSVTKVVE